MPRQPLGAELHHGQRNASLNPALQLVELEVHIDGVAELGMVLFQRAEFDSFPGFAPGRTYRPATRVTHQTIIPLR